jgi:BirA family transcriptional regulator, biotin operon repressor / biotin---[acetyl-CoA-carboxylase] ligase
MMRSTVPHPVDTFDTRILRALRTCEGGVSGADLAEELGVRRAAVWERIQELRDLGYVIEASPHQGYRLLSAPDVLHADDLLARLDRNRVIGRDVRVFEETTSTNDIVEKLARDDVAEGVVVFAETQTRGRGRLGRVWVSPRGKGLWLSILLRPSLRPVAVTRLTIAAAMALVRAVEGSTGLRAGVKWPNDLVLGGRKVAGILLETRADQDRVRHVIMGIGVDVNQAGAEFPPDLRGAVTSLRMESGRFLSRSDLAVALLRELDRDYARAVGNGFDALAAEWESRCVTLGQRVSIQAGQRWVEGRAESLDADGALLVRTQHGRLERMTGGDVTLAKETDDSPL